MIDIKSMGYVRVASTDLATWTYDDAGRPRSYTRRLGDPNIVYTTVQGAWYLQDDARVRPGAGGGGEVELQRLAAGRRVHHVRRRDERGRRRGEGGQEGDESEHQDTLRGTPHSTPRGRRNRPG